MLAKYINTETRLVQLTMLTKYINTETRLVELTNAYQINQY